MDLHTQSSTTSTPATNYNSSIKNNNKIKSKNPRPKSSHQYHHISQLENSYKESKINYKISQLANRTKTNLERIKHDPGTKRPSLSQNTIIVSDPNSSINHNNKNNHHFLADRKSQLRHHPRDSSRDSRSSTHNYTRDSSKPPHPNRERSKDQIFVTQREKSSDLLHNPLRNSNNMATASKSQNSKEYIKLQYDTVNGTIFCQDPNFLNNKDSFLNNLPAPPPKPVSLHERSHSPPAPNSLPYGRGHSPRVPASQELYHPADAITSITSANTAAKNNYWREDFILILGRVWWTCFYENFIC